ncbi:hypothetical protein INR49_007244 [Caranx melampygus]|nr:hypothetical protein INR49_007244 [Caranx melampygus]
MFYIRDQGQESFNSRSLAMQAQKKILSKMATMVVANMLTDDTSSEILDELYKASREFTKSKKEAHKIIKDVIKIALKIGILYRNHQFSPDELDTVERFKKKMNQAAMTAVSFYEVEYTFDRNILSELLLECRDLLHTLVEQHLTARSHARIDHVFNHFAHGEFLAELYGDAEEYRLSLRKICNGINKLLDEERFNLPHHPVSPLALSPPAPVLAGLPCLHPSPFPLLTPDHSRPPPPPPPPPPPDSSAPISMELVVTS